MTLLSSLKERLRRTVPQEDTDPEKAYDLWASYYDAQPGNLMLDLDEDLFSGILNSVNIDGKVVVDIGCGTGRHWNKIFAKKPKSLSGYDVSEGMIAKLKEKFPCASVSKLINNSLPGLANSSVDVIVSTLTIAHIENIEEAFVEWARVLKTNGEIIITDYHPEAFMKGANRTFPVNGKTVAIRNFTHSIGKLHGLLRSMGFEALLFVEKKIDASMKPYYEEKQALHVFEKFNGVPIIYGTLLKKTDAAT